MPGLQGVKGAQTNRNQERQKQHAYAQPLRGHQFGQHIPRGLYVCSRRSASACSHRGRCSTDSCGGRNLKCERGLHVLRRRLNQILCIVCQLSALTFLRHRGVTQQSAVNGSSHDLLPTNALQVIPIFVGHFTGQDLQRRFKESSKPHRW